MIKKELAMKLFEAFSIQRWNNRIRPINLIEMDKQAHKTIIIFIIAIMKQERMDLERTNEKQNEFYEID